MPNHIHGIIISRRGLIHQTLCKTTHDKTTHDKIPHTKTTHNKSQIQNNADDYKQNQMIPGMINHAPTDWMLLKNPKTTLGKIIRYFKARTTKMIHDSNINDFKWQRSFYDHIIWNDKSLNNIREYIVNNPAKWNDDENNIKNYKVKNE